MHLMNTTAPQALNVPRRLPERDLSPGYPASGRSTRGASLAADGDHQWLLDLSALVRCRELLGGHGVNETWQGAEQASYLSPMDVPAEYDEFCRSHFASVKRLHPDLTWDDACPAYAIALSAHAVLCVELDEEKSRQLELHWPRIRGQSTLDWPQARALIADGCSALARLDPLAMQR
jgi:hypothetical protein